MASCERCWWRAHERDEYDNDPGAAYHAEMLDAEHEKAVCTLQTIEGAKARAGEFWNEETQCDRRGVVAKYALREMQ